MKQYVTVYPLFEKYLDQMEYEINRCVELKNPSKSILSSLEHLFQIVEGLKLVLRKEPSVSNVNFEQAVNEVYKMDNSLSGVIIQVQFKEKLDSSKLGFINFKLMV
ncbi:hypothetical protein [Leeuwenhoekiella nanhaiensis]|uniref:Uncharacterized protein n=1 Tax=Leeuwenhoekiella nanhaiensis TaxID=1655491 RepID=A0A2G1VPU5_9FLAO|nr:hypothetical protein [Leeuwenhoekiella nanhaiensis]PHQ28798.1 hypothetical protein CJ305_13350 [Leeuwenhoekiella nanhaiensis]